MGFNSSYKVSSPGNSEKISDAQRHVIYLVLGVFCAIGMCCFLLLAPSETPVSISFHEYIDN